MKLSQSRCERFSHARPATRAFLALSLIAVASLTACGGDGGGDSTPAPSPTPTPTPTRYSTPTPPLPPAPPADYARRSVPLAGTLEFGQTSIVGQEETRTAPRPAEGRSTLLLFTPAASMADTRNVFVEATLNGVPMGRLYMKRPSTLAGYAEDRLTASVLPRYSTQAWSVQMPGGWIKPNISLSVGFDEVRDDEKRVYEHRLAGALPSLAAPSEFRISRAKILLMEGPDSNADTRSAEAVADELYARVPFAKLSFVDYLPARWDYFIAPRAPGGTAVGQPSVPTQINTAAQIDPFDYANQVTANAVLTSRANRGQGLRAVVESFAVESQITNPTPFADATAVSEGRYLDANGQFADPTTSARGGDWQQGWAKIRWNHECNSEMTRALGTSLGLTYNDVSESLSWSASDAQPYDTIRGVFRTWYAAADGFVLPPSASGLAGRNDPVSVRFVYDPPDSQSCHSPYTNVTTARMQNWLDGSPTIRNVDGTPGIYGWSPATRTYIPVTPNYVPVGPDWTEGDLQLAPEHVDVPVVTLIGTIAADAHPAANQIYPPMYAASGNTFAMPELGQAAPAYGIGRYAVRVTYANGQQRVFAISQEHVTYGLFMFAFNLPLGDDPREVTLFRLATNFSEVPATNLALTGHTALFTRTIDAPSALPAVVTRGGNPLVEARTAMVNGLCTTDVCDKESVNVAWHPDDGSQLYFTASDGAYGATVADENARIEPMRLSVTMVGQDGTPHTVVFRAVRSVNTAASGFRHTPANYWTGLEPLADNLHRLDIWAHADDNSALPAGEYKMADALKLLDVHAVNGAGTRVVDRVMLNAAFKKN